MKPVEPVELQNSLVRLVPIAPDHAPAFFSIGQEPSIWTYLSTEPFRELDDAKRWIELMLTRDDYAVTYSVYDVPSGRLAGSTSFLGVQTRHSALEIGFTWYGKAFQRTYVNLATKLALLSHAFDELGAYRVQMKTDKRNLASQRAIERIGGVKEGVLRKHKTYPDGFVRDTVVYSIVDDEWPSIRDKLTNQLLASI